jgi:hypothetical protein
VAALSKRQAHKENQNHKFEIRNEEEEVETLNLKHEILNEET